MGLKNWFDLALVSVDFFHDSTAVFVSCIFLFFFYQYQRKFKCAFIFCLSDSRLIFAWFLLVFCLFFSLIFAWFLLVFCLYFFINFCLFFACFFSKTNSKLKYDSDLSTMGTRQLSRNWLEVNWIFIRALADRKQGKGLIWDYEGNGRYKTRQEQMFKAQHYFYIFLMYIHTYPEEDKMIDILKTQRIKVHRSSWFISFAFNLFFCCHICTSVFMGGESTSPWEHWSFWRRGGIPSEVEFV